MIECVSHEDVECIRNHDELAQRGMRNTKMFLLSIGGVGEAGNIKMNERPSQRSPQHTKDLGHIR